MQRLTILFLAVCSVIFAAALISAQTSGPATQSGQIGYHEDPNADQKRTLLLKDFKPATMMHASVHEVTKAKFYVIDVHNHVNDAARIDEHIPPQRAVEAMDNTNVKTIVILTGMWGDKLQAVLDEMVKGDSKETIADRRQRKLELDALGRLDDQRLFFLDQLPRHDFIEYYSWLGSRLQYLQ